MERYPTGDMESIAGVLDRRAEAVILDALLVVLVVGVIGYAAGTLLIGGGLGGFGGLLFSVQFVAPVVLLVYQAGFEGWYGQTLGKRLRGIVVVKDDGSEMTWGASIIRNLLRIVDALPAFYILGIVAAYATDENQRLGDVAASTTVVHTQD